MHDVTPSRQPAAGRMTESPREQPRSPSDGSAGTRIAERRPPGTHLARLLTALVAVATAGVLLDPCRSCGQVISRPGAGSQGGGYPSELYFQALSVYRSGDIADALELFDVAEGRTRIDANGRWIDSIPVLAMQAECHWHLGNLAACHQSIERATQIAVRRRGWLSNIDWGGILRPAVINSVDVRLWPEANSIRVLPVAEALTHTSGINLLQQPNIPLGVIEEQNARVVDVVEVLRSMAVLSYRRRMLLGPLTEQNPSSRAILDASKFPARLQHPVARGLITALRGTEYFALFDDPSAIQRSLQSARLNGGVHPLSPLILLCHAHSLSHAGKTDDAVTVALECANVSARLGQDEWIGEALQLAAGCVRGARAGSLHQAASLAGTAMMRRSRLAALHGTLAAADAALTAGKTAAAMQLMEQAQVISNSRDVVCPRLVAYAAYLRAVASVQQGGSLIGTARSPAVDAIARVRQFGFYHRRSRGRESLVSMPRLFQTALVTSRAGGSRDGQAGQELAEAYLSEPPVELWRRDPVDALVDSLAEKAKLEAAWLDLATLRPGDPELVRRIDHLLSRRLLYSRPLGGRVTQIRGLARPDQDLFGPAARAFLARPPDSITKLRLAAAAGMPADAADRVAIAGSLERQAARIALGRIAPPHVMPPRLGQGDLAARLPPGFALLAFFNSGKRTLVSLTTPGGTDTWAIPAASGLSREVAGLLKQIGVGNLRGKRLPETTEVESRAVAARLFKRLVPDPRVAAKISATEHLVVVPDGPLWYLPFELLVPAGAVANEPPAWEALPLDRLGDVTAVRYAATPGLGVFPVAKPGLEKTVAVVANQFFVPGDTEANENVVESILESLDKVIRLPKSDPAPCSLIGDRFGHLFVGAAGTLEKKSARGFAVAAYDATTAGGSVAAWEQFPLPAPQTVILPGLRTPVDLGRAGDGSELFELIGGLQIAGVREILTSRWAVGGRSTATVSKELLKEINALGLVGGWRRAVSILRQTPLDPAAEPRLTQAEHDREDVTGDQPFFWSGYLITAPVKLLPASPP